MTNPNKSAQNSPDNPLDLPPVIGHRGASGYAPENTAACLTTAAQLGLSYVQLDVRLTKDEIPILFTDLEIDRITMSSGPVAEMTFDELSELDAGHHFGESFIGQSVLSLEEGLDLLFDHQLTPVINLAPNPGEEVATAEIALDMISQCWPADAGRPDSNLNRPVICSSQKVTLETARDIIPQWPRVLNLNGWDDQWVDMAKYLMVSGIWVTPDMLERQIVSEINQTGLQIIAGPTSDVMEAESLYDWGVDSIISPMPDEVMFADNYPDDKSEADILDFS
jgi:glycerophosphoryl diester phosphodiesterase